MGKGDAEAQAKKYEMAKIDVSEGEKDKVGKSGGQSSQFSDFSDQDSPRGKQQKVVQRTTKGK